MSILTPDFCSLTQVVTWLTRLHEQQKKGLLDSAFEIKNQLNFAEMPVYQELIASDEQLCFYAAKLFGVDIKNLSLLKKRLVTREHCYEMTFETADEQRLFFIKRAWEGAIKEAIGLEFNNLLTDTPIRYLCGQDIIITEKVFEPLPTDTLYELRESADYIFAYGAWEVFTHLLRLTDRKTTNVRWNGKRLANIDFGLVFYKGKPVFDSRFTLTKKTEQRKQGQIYALKHVLTRFRQHREKLEMLLVNLDVHFCRNTPCSRTPREPLRILLAALKEFEPDMLNSIVMENPPAQHLPPLPVSKLPVVTHQPPTRKYIPLQESILQSLLGIDGILYAALMTAEGVILDEIESPQYHADCALKKQNLSMPLKNSVLNQHLLELILNGRNNCILKAIGSFKKSESIQIDLTEMRLLVIWDKETDNEVMALSLLDLDTSVAHVKVNMRRAIEKFSAL